MRTYSARECQNSKRPTDNWCVMVKSELWKVHIAQVVVQLCGACYIVLAKSSLTAGLNQVILSIYQKLTAVICLLIVSAFQHSRGPRPRLTGYAVLLMFFAGLNGIYLGQIWLLTGLHLTGSAATAAMQNAMPVFAFVIAAIFGLEEVRYARRDGVAKILGVVLCVSGAMVMSFYRGPVVLGTVPSGDGQPAPEDIPLDGGGYIAQLVQSTALQAGISSWQLGILYLLASTLCIAIFVNLQAAVVAIYPAPAQIVLFVSVFGLAMLVVTGLLTAAPAEWAVTKTSDIVTILYGGSVASGFCSAMSTWCLQRAGPVLVAAYMPLLAVFSAVLGLLLLDDFLCLGSILGALLIFGGLYLVTWGKEAHRRFEAQVLTGLPISPGAGESGDLGVPLLK